MREDYPPYRAGLSLDPSLSKPPSVNRWNFLSVFLGFLVTAFVFLLSSGDAMTGPASSTQVLGMARKSSKGQAVPTMHVVGDSTCAINGLNIGGPTRGWCQYMHRFLTLPINNKALSGRSARTYTTEGDWDRLKPFIKSGDLVYMGMGINDEGWPPEDGYHRNDLSDEDPDATIVVIKEGKNETVHTYQWYVTRWIDDIRAAGAIPIIASHIATNDWSGESDNHAQYFGARGLYNWYAWKTAKASGSTFVNHNYATKIWYEELGYEKVQAFYPPGDAFHLYPEAADLVAERFFMALKCEKGEASDALEPYFTERTKLLVPSCEPADDG